MAARELLAARPRRAATRRRIVLQPVRALPSDTWTGGGVGVGDVLQAVGLAVQALAVAASVFLARRTVKESRAARREEAERHREERREIEAFRREEEERRLTDARRARQEEVERRLWRLVELVVALDELRSEIEEGSGEAKVKLPLARRRLFAAAAATPLTLKWTLELAREAAASPSQGRIDAALHELLAHVSEFAEAGPPLGAP